MEYLIKDKLILEIYTIGYDPMGESIVFFIIGDGNVLFTGVVDCYEKEKINRTLELLNEKNVKIVNFVCLTHPDKDHCKGLDKVLEKADSNTHIVYPAYLFKENAKYDNEVNKAVDKIAYFLNLNSNNKNKNYKMTSCIGKQEILSQSQYRYKNLKTGLIYPLIINTYTPIAEIIERYSAKVFLGKNAKPTSHIKKEENIEECGVLKLTVDIFNSTIHVEKSQNVQELSKN